jgi:hypothetical protein
MNRERAISMDQIRDAGPAAEEPDRARRAALRRLGRFAATTPPAVTLLLVATRKADAGPGISGEVSSKTLKSVDGNVDEASLLSAVAALPVDRWRYKPETGLSQQLHIGPYAEDFKASFGIGDGVTINTTDALGICLAAIKALTARVASLEAELRAKTGDEQ